MYRLGYYNPNAEMICLATANTQEEAKEKYERLHDEWKCTIWIQKVEYINPKDL